MTDISAVVRRRIHLAAQRDELAEEIRALDAQIIDWYGVGSSVEVDGQAVYRVQQARKFNLDLARKVLPAEVIAMCTTTETVQAVDTDRLKALAKGLGLLRECEKPNAASLNTVKARP